MTWNIETEADLSERLVPDDPDWSQLKVNVRTHSLV